MQHTSFAFFASRRFLPLFLTQFLGALNDNLMKTALLVMVSYAGLHFAGLPPEQIVNLASAAFILPFFLFSATAGRLAEKYDKAYVAKLTKVAELVIMALAAWGFLQQHVGLLLFTLFLMGAQSTFFGPVKYAVLPQYLKGNELLGGNGLIEMGTFIAILIGQMGGALLMQYGDSSSVLALLAVALLGWLASLFLPSAPAAAPHLTVSYNIIGDTRQLLRATKQYREVSASIMGISWFWLLGATYTTQMPTFTRLHLHGDASVYTLILTLFSLGIAIGSILCAKLSRGRLELGLVLMGGAGMTVFGVDLYFSVQSLTPTGHLLTLSDFLAQASHWRSLVDFIGIGIAGGFFTVPLYTWLQTASPEDFRAQAIAANNIINGLYMVVSAALSMALLALTHSIALLLLCISLANLLAMWRLCHLAPEVWHNRGTWLQRGAS